MKNVFREPIREIPGKVGKEKIHTVLQKEYAKYDEIIESTIKFANTCEKLIMEIYKKYDPFVGKFNVEEIRRMFEKIVGRVIDFNMEESITFPCEPLIINFEIETDDLLELLNKNNINLELLKRILYDNLSNVLYTFDDIDSINNIQVGTKTIFSIFIDAKLFLKCSDEIIDKKIEDIKMRVRKY